MEVFYFSEMRHSYPKAEMRVIYMCPSTAVRLFHFSHWDYIAWKTFGLYIYIANSRKKTGIFKWLLDMHKVFSRSNLLGISGDNKSDAVSTVPLISTQADSELPCFWNVLQCVCWRTNCSVVEMQTKKEKKKKKEKRGSWNRVMTVQHWYRCCCF